MKLRLLDIQTKQVVDLDSPFDDWWWTEGNGSCDCNRLTAFNRLPINETCLGSKRYLVIFSDDPFFSFDLYNQYYPDAMIDQYRHFEAKP